MQVITFSPNSKLCFLCCNSHYLRSLCMDQAFHCCTRCMMSCDRPDLLKMISKPSPDTYVLLNMDASTVHSPDPGNM